jgi:hypothetical protein
MVLVNTWEGLLSRVDITQCAPLPCSRRMQGAPLLVVLILPSALFYSIFGNIESERRDPGGRPTEFIKIADRAVPVLSFPRSNPGVSCVLTISTGRICDSARKSWRSDREWTEIAAPAAGT